MELDEIVELANDVNKTAELAVRAEASLSACISSMGRERLAAICRFGGRLYVDLSGEPWFTWPSIPAGEYEYDRSLAFIEVFGAPPSNASDPDDIRARFLAEVPTWAGEVATQIRAKYHDFDWDNKDFG